MRAADLNGKSDPYCIVRLGRHKMRTKIIRETLWPKWNETFTVPAEEVESIVTSTSGVLTFEVWDSDYMAHDDFLGQVRA